MEMTLSRTLSEDNVRDNVLQDNIQDTVRGYCPGHVVDVSGTMSCKDSIPDTVSGYCPGHVLDFFVLVVVIEAASLEGARRFSHTLVLLII